MADEPKRSPRWYIPLTVAAAGLAVWAGCRSGGLNDYYQLVLMTLGINVMLAVSLNLINGFMGEFSVGHAGFMAVGAYVSAALTMNVFSVETGAALFPLSVVAGGLAAALTGAVVALPSFRTRGDYLAIVTLAFGMIVKSVLENIEAVGGPRGLPVDRITTLSWVFGWVVITLWVLANLVNSKYGRGMTAVRDDEIAAELCGVPTRRVKVAAFVVAAFFAGVAGGLFAHLNQYIYPKSFDILKSTEILVMIYLGGTASLTGAIVGATLFTVAAELLRQFQEWRMVILPVLLILLMLFRPCGIVGRWEWSWLRPRVR